MAVNWAYWLFSQTNTTGSAFTEAKLSASWKLPLLVPPSPKKHTATCPEPRCSADSPAPAAMPNPPPTMPLAPSMPSEKSATCIDPPRPRLAPVSLPNSSAINRSVRMPLAMAWPWPRWVEVM